MKTVSIAFISSHGRAGGSEQYMQSLLRELGPDWINDVVVLDEGPFVGRLREDGHEPIVLPTGAGRLDIFAVSFKLRHLLKNRRPQLVHANGVKAGLIAAFALWGLNIPFVWLKHDFSFDGSLARFIAGRAARVIGVSQVVVASLPEKKTRVIYTGIRPSPPIREKARAAVLEQLGGPGDLVGLIGRLHEVKGHMELLAAAPAILAIHPRARFVFVGGEDPSSLPYAHEIRARVRSAGLTDRVIELGHRDDVLDVMAALDIAVMPSIRDRRGMGREAFPLAGLELMNVGTPVVAYADGGLPELFGDCSILVSAGDRKALADGVVELLSDPDRRDRLSRCGRDRVQKLFNLERWADELRNEYSQISAEQ